MVAISSYSNTATDARTIVVLGDSLSAAYQMPVERGWVSLMRDELIKTHDQVEVINASVSGATTAAGLQILPSVMQQHRPDILVLALGANDGLQGKPLPYIRRNLERLISLAETGGATILLVGIRIPPNYGSAYTEPFFHQFADLARERQLAYLPFLLDGVAGDDALMMSDGLHPEPEAQPRILRNVLEALRPMLSK